MAKCPLDHLVLFRTSFLSFKGLSAWLIERTLCAELLEVGAARSSHVAACSCIVYVCVCVCVCFDKFAVKAIMDDLILFLTFLLPSVYDLRAPSVLAN